MSEHTPRRLGARILWQGVLPVVVLAAALLGGRWLILTAPIAPRQPPARTAPLVEVLTIVAAQQELAIEAMGTVLPARSVELKAPVAGPVAWLSSGLVPGHAFAAGEPLLSIEARDFELLVAQRSAELDAATAEVATARQRRVQAERDLQLKQGNRTVALRDFELLGEEIPAGSRALVLREPQLARAEAELSAIEAALESAAAHREAAVARLESARLDLARTRIVAPFACVVMEKLVELGDRVATSTPLVRLVGSEEFWLELSVPLADLRWVRLPTGEQPGSRVRVWTPGAAAGAPPREAQVIRLLPAVDGGHRARVLVSVPDPLAHAQRGVNGATEHPPAGLRPKPSVPLLLHSHVQAEILAFPPAQAVAVPRELLRGTGELWILDDADRLEIRSVQPIYRGRHAVVIGEGLRPGERVVTTDLAAPVQGMPLRLAAASPAPTPAAAP